jgi:dimeric dUTPase (all-alpha-NTP-PPase superfamily)
MTDTDKFSEMFRLQEELNKRIGVADFGAMNEQEQTQWILNYCRAMTQELAELTDSVPWKWWAKYQTFDKQNARVEVVDLFHFLISIAQVLGMTADDVHRLYTQKNKVNHQRQETGYSVKDESDNKDIGQG